MATLHARHRGLLALLALGAAACSEPVVGEKLGPAPAPTGYRLAIGDATVDATSRVQVTFTLTRDGQPVPIGDVPALGASFTLAGLLTDPVSGLATWQSYLPVGAGTLANLPLGGPGTPPSLVLKDQRQPGAEAASFTNLRDLGDGRLVITLATQLPATFDPARTMRVGAWLEAVSGTDDTSATLDLVPSGGPVVQRETVLDANCRGCHGRLTGHGGLRTGVRLCLTCHTIQNADPDTSDPAAQAQGLSVSPDQRTVVAGTGATSFTATLLSSTATVSWTLSPATGAGTLSTATVATTTTGGSTSTVKYTPPAADAAVTLPIEVRLTASITVTGSKSNDAAYVPAPITLRSEAALAVVQPEAGATVVMTPVAQSVVAFGAAVPLTALFPGLGGTATWKITSPASGGGTLGTATNAVAGGNLTSSASYTPPAAVAGPTTVTVTATAGAVVGTATLTVLPGVPGSATRATDPNPLDLGRLVHRLHRGKFLPTLYLSTSIAPAPPLTPDPVSGLRAALPLPFFPTGRNAVAPGARFSYRGDGGVERLVGRIVSRTDNFQPAKVQAEGITFPRDLRDCDACHRGAPQEQEVVDAISRRTCGSCHPDVWFGDGPITDLVHFAHAGGPQADDTRCAECHVPAPPGRPTVLAPIAPAHLPIILSPSWNPLTLEVTRVSGFQGGQKPRVCFTVRDREGALTSLSAPAPPTESTSATPSPLPRALARLSIAVAGPTTDYLMGNTTFTQTVPLTTPFDEAAQEFCHDFTAALPAAAAGTWGLGMEARRTSPAPVPTHYDPATGAFRWPYTGESVTEYADNPVVYVDAAFGTWPGGAPAPRRQVVDRAGCRKCHLEVTFHGGLRHNPEYCVLCHTPDATDWARRPKGPDGAVNLGTVYSDTKFGTYDNIEERSIHLKVMLHRVHTGAGQGTARLEVAAPHVVAGLFLDQGEFPNRLADCTLCHPGKSWLLEGQPADAAPTSANETASLAHAASATHVEGEGQLLPIAATCNSCHGTSFAYQHAASYTVDGVEACAQCHTKGALGVPAAHGLAAP